MGHHHHHDHGHGHHHHDHGHGHHHHDHDHSTTILGLKKDFFYAILSGVFLLTAFLLEKLTSVPRTYYLVSYALTYLFGGYYTVLHSWESLKRKKFDIDFLMLVAAIGAASLGKFAEGGLLLFLFSIGHALEHYALDKATHSISSLTELAPSTALLRKNGKIVETQIDQLKIGDVVVVRPNSKIPADGMVIKGKAAVNQAPITGESVPVDKFPMTEKHHYDFENLSSKNKVYAGSINGHSSLEVQVFRLSKDSTLARLVRLVQAGQSEQGPAQRFADKFAAIFVPAVLFIVVLLLFAFRVLDETFKDSFYRAMAVLVAASPCALAISTPSAVLAGIARAAKTGILIKGGAPLDQMAKINAIAFDKTGTLTKGEPQLTEVVPFGKHSQTDLLKVAVAIEDLSEHPLARAIVRDGKKQLNGVLIPEAQHLKSITARGVSGQINGENIYIGNRRLMEETTQAPLPAELEQRLVEIERNGHTAMIVLKETSYYGIIAVQDVARTEAAESINRLKSKVGIKKMIMLTGDNQLVADAIAKKVGIEEAYGDLLPEDKVAAVKREKENFRVAMVGDGVNDAPAMAYSDVGISMGAAGSDVALETAQVALLGDSIRQLPFALLLAKQSVAIIRQNLFISIGVMAILVPLTIAGLSIGPAIVIHEGSTLLVVANALRLLGFNKENKQPKTK